MKHKICTTCGKSKPISSFYKHSRSKDGLNNECKECQSIRTKIYRKTDNFKERITQTRFRTKHRLRARSTINSHQVKGYKVTITIDELEDLFSKSTHCPICGVEYSLDLDKGHSQISPSLDRINNENELRVDNVWIVCKRCNFMKGDLTMKEFVEKSRMVAEKFKELY